MKKRMILVLLMLCLAISPLLGEQAKSYIDSFHMKFKIAFIQANLFNNDGDNVTDNTTYKLGLGLGFAFHIPLVKGLLHANDGFALEINALCQANYYNSELEYYTDPAPVSLTFPILGKYYIYRDGDKGVNVQIGPSLDFPLLNIGDGATPKSFVLGFVLGVGIDLGGTMLDFRYEWGLTEMYNNTKCKRFYFGISL